MNNPIFKDLIKEDQTLFGFHGIYPEELDIEETPPSARTPFLDVTIQCSTRLPYNLETIHYSKFDEKEYAKLHRPPYPARHTNIAMSQKEGVIKGRLTSLSRHITERHDFMRRSWPLSELANQLVVPPASAAAQGLRTTASRARRAPVTPAGGCRRLVGRRRHRRP